jgi:hypothetical protein
LLVESYIKRNWLNAGLKLYGTAIVFMRISVSDCLVLLRYRTQSLSQS